jgi:hypothetical protein
LGEAYGSIAMKKTLLNSMSRIQISQGFTFATTFESAVSGVMTITVP